MCFESQMTLD